MLRNGIKPKKSKKSANRGGRHDGVCRIVLLRVFSKTLGAAAAVMLLPCFLCIEYSAAEIFAVIIPLSFVKSSPAAARCIAAVFAAVGLFFAVAGFSAKFASECESMYVPGASLAAPKNMLTLKNGIRYLAFRVIFAVRRACDSVRFFSPAAVAAVLFAAGLYYGMDTYAAIAAVCAFFAVFAVGTVFFACSGEGRRRGTAVLYASRLASPLTAARAAAAQRGDAARAVKRELRLLPFRLLSLLPAVRLFADAKMRKKRGADAIKSLYKE